MVPEITLEPTVHLGHTVRDTLQIPKPSFSQQLCTEEKEGQRREKEKKTRISAQHHDGLVACGCFSEDGPCSHRGLAVRVGVLLTDCVVVGYICRTNLCKDMDL